MNRQSLHAIHLSVSWQAKEQVLFATSLFSMSFERAHFAAGSVSFCAARLSRESALFSTFVSAFSIAAASGDIKVFVSIMRTYFVLLLYVCDLKRDGKRLKYCSIK